VDAQGDRDAGCVISGTLSGEMDNALSATKASNSKIIRRCRRDVYVVERGDNGNTPGVNERPA